MISCALSTPASSDSHKPRGKEENRVAEEAGEKTDEVEEDTLSVG